MNLIDRIAYRISRKSREKKFSIFLKQIAPQPEETILDVGVNDTEYSETDNYLEKQYPYPENITAVSQESLTAFSKRYPNIKAIIADGKSLPFPDNAFDIAYSNAVIEHVGSQEKQLHFLKELFRVSRRGYLTTPNRHFPIEVHTRVPLLHLLLPKNIFHAFLKLIGKSWATGDYMHLLSPNELTSLLEKAGIHGYTMSRQRFLGFTMTLTVIWKK